jgi:2-oxoglutarate dehydrogenase E1 component
MVVANVTEPSNFFHLLRRQLTWDFRKPCVVMSPKSLLRHPKVISPLSEFTQGSFKEVIDDNNVKAKDVKRVILCSGKIYYDLEEAREKDKIKDVAIVRIEQLHPLPIKQIKDTLAAYEKAELVYGEEDKFIRFHWVNSPKEEYFEFSIDKSEVTNQTILIIKDFGEKKEIKDQSQLWEYQVKDLFHRLGA